MLPEELKDKDVRVSFLPGKGNASHFQGVTGPSTVYCAAPPESITRVTISVRPLKTVVVADIPLEPDPGSTYVPRHFLPSPVQDAKEGMATLSNDYSIEIFGLADRQGKAWSKDGKRLEKVPKWRVSNPSYLADEFNRQQLTRLMVDESDNSRESAQSIYDGEGWPLFRSFSTVVWGDKTTREFYLLGDRPGEKSDLVVPVRSDSPSSVVTLRRGQNGGGEWSFSKARSGALSVRFEASADMDPLKGDVRVSLLDAKGGEVRNADGSLSYSFEPGSAQFYVTQILASRVAALRIEVRPYTWVRFPNVALAPMSDR